MAKKFLFVYRGNSEQAAAFTPSPEQMQALMASWGAWIGKFMQSGQLVDPGDALQMSGKVLRPNGVVTDGPFVEAKELLGGYSVIQVDTYEQAVAIAKECPAHRDGDTIEIRELAGLAG